MLLLLCVVVFCLFVVVLLLFVCVVVVLCVVFFFFFFFFFWGGGVYVCVLGVFLFRQWLQIICTFRIIITPSLNPPIHKNSENRLTQFKGP